MCGIIGYIGKDKAPLFVLNGLKRLEYRGYDSWGICIKNNGSSSIKKGVGSIDDAFSKSLHKLEGEASIGHTRWATHGGVTEENAHPHLSSDSSIAVVHNGIIENYQELKKNLQAKGHIFRSQTDSEVIPRLIEEECKISVPKTAEEFAGCVASALKMLKGSFALIAFDKDINAMVGARLDSPLSIGLCEEGYFMASDPVAFIESTDKVIHLEDGEMAAVSL